MYTAPEEGTSSNQQGGELAIPYYSHKWAKLAIFYYLVHKWGKDFRYLSYSIMFKKKGRVAEIL